MASATLRLFLLLVLFSVACAQSNGTHITIGSSLIAGDTTSASAQPWRSPSDDFAFGFQNVHDDVFLLAIWFYKIPENTTVWFAKEGKNPILAPRGSKIELTASEGLVLRNPQGGEIWKSKPITGFVTGGVMNDTGNFVLVIGNNGSVWESFENPSDTLLPTQRLGINGVLSSRKTQYNYSNGRFQFRLLADGNAVLNTISLDTGGPFDAYYISVTWDPASTQNSGLQVVFDENGFLYVLKRNGVKVNLTIPDDSFPAKTYYQRVTMNFDGVLTVSSYAKSPGIDNRSWKDLRRIPENICLSIAVEKFGSGICGFNSICTLKSDGRPNCNCPEGYSLIDPDYEFGNCKLDIPHSCEEESGGNSIAAGLYQMVDVENTNFPIRDFERNDSFSEEDCKRSCLEDCFCVAAVYGVSGCWKKGTPLSNGRTDVNDRSVTSFKLRKNTSFVAFEDSHRGGQKKNQDAVIVALSVLLAGSVFVIFMLVGLKGFSFFFLKRNILPQTPNCNLFQFTYKELEKATKNFKEELGRGSCGIVYRGTIQTGPIAVKKLDRMFDDKEREFRTEMNVIGRTHHKNLVRLLGYCKEGNNRMLVYQFMSNGALSSFLFNGDDLKPSWNLRAQMGYEIARGLLYLHEECNTQIIHCDIKPQNILLDDNFNAKISDFGLAKLLRIDQSRTETGIRGTKGYVAPDWFRSAPVNAKVDVYSFGVLLLELICCRRNVGDIEAGGEMEVLTDLAYHCYEEGRLDNLIEGDKEAMNDFERVERFVKVAIWCIQEDPSMRPTMKKVTLMIEGNAIVSVPPCPYPFSSII